MSNIKKDPKLFDTDISWMSKAACKGRTELFFDVDKEGKRARQMRETAALSLCKSCAVANDCRDYGRRNGEYGIWGSESEFERWSGGWITDIWMKRRSRAAANRELRRAAGVHKSTKLADVPTTETSPIQSQ